MEPLPEEEPEPEEITEEVTDPIPDEPISVNTTKPAEPLPLPEEEEPFEE